ncbi:hypothetical protein GJAV_G00010570 [Gymnothorax javanicus]|nr:hypothetical protein GJAV_G00010570 [Gymnothorax javanicus]
MAHQCSVCLKMFTCPSKLQRHHLIHTGEKPFVCSVCGKAFRQAIHLKKHLETHTGNAPTNNPFPSYWEQPESFSCDEPESAAYPTFQGKFSLTADVSLQSCGSSEVEELRERVQSEDYALSLKANSEQPEFKLISPDSAVCTEWEYPHRNDSIKQMLQEFPVTFTGAGNAISNPDDVLQCAVCSKFCSSPCQLEKHLLVHSKVGTFECSICTQTFSQESEMKLHSQTHAQEDLPQVISDMSSSPEEVPQCNPSKGNIKIKYQCPQCPKSFCSPSKLRRHCLTHTGQRPYYCLECGKSFRQLAHLKTHQNTHRKVQNVEASSYEDTAGASISKDGNVDKYQLPSGEPPSLNYSLSLGLQNPDPLDSQQLASAGIPSNLNRTDRTFQMAQKQEGSIPVSEHTNEWNSEEDPVFVKAGFHGGSIKNSNRSDWKPFECIECGQTFSEAANFQNHRCESTDQDDFAHQGEGMEGNSSLSVESPEETTRLWDCDRKMNSQIDDMNELDLNIIIKQENWPSLNKEDVSTPNGIVCDSEFQLQPALGYTKVQQKELTRSSHQCNTCLKYFATPYKLRRHILIHTGQKPFSCRVCGKRFRQRAHLVLHNHTHFRPEHIKRKRMKSNSRPSSIQIGYDYDSSGSLLNSDVSAQIHIPESVGAKESVLVSTEMNVPSIKTLDQNSVIYDQSLDGKRKASFRKHQCSLCFKCFSCPSKLQRHHLIHTGQKPFRCTLCEKTFSQAIHLKVHQRTHNKRMPFGSAFLQKRLVNAAVSNLPTLHCQEKDSGPVNATSENAKAELAIFCENNGSVELEDRHSTSNGDLRNTLKELVSTKQCKFQLMSNNSVNECEEGKKKAYQCTTCMERFFTPFKLRRHVLTHTGPRPFSCNFCGKKFRQHAHMKFHICARNQPRFSQQTEKVKNDLLSVQKVEFNSVSSEAN